MFSHKNGLKAMCAFFAMGLALYGCGQNQGNTAPSGPPPRQTLQQKIQAIQNNPELPPPAKQAAIQKLQQQAGSTQNSGGQ